MKIARISAICRNIPLTGSFKFASTELTELPYAWVRVETDTGLVGYGECPTYWDPSGETQWAAVGAIEYMRPKLTGLDPLDLEQIFTLFDRDAYGAFAAKCGLDSALYDIAGKHLGVPVYLLLGGGSAHVSVNAVLPLGIGNELGARVQSLLAQGYRVFKVKVGADLEQEVALVRELAHLLPPEATICLDANQAWGDAKAAIRAIRRFEPLGVAWIEQPIVAHDVEGLRTVREAVDVAIMADESIYSPVDALRLIRAQAVDMFNIKLAKSGGMYLGKQVWAIARAGNIGCMLGSMIESSLGMLADYHFARAHPMRTCGLSAYSLVKEDVDVGLRLTGGELVLESERPGLGYPDAAAYEHYFRGK